jgi:hypothetical protein
VVWHVIATHLGLASCRERMHQLLHALELRWLRLRHRHLKAKPEEPVAFRTALEAPLAEWPEDGDWIVVDEATVRRHPTVTAQWCVVEAVPEAPSGEDHTTGHVDGAVAPLTGRTHDHVSSELGQEECAPFLQPLSVYDPGKRRLVIHARGTQPKGPPSRRSSVQRQAVSCSSRSRLTRPS